MLGKTLRKVRESAGLTQEQLAKKMGMTRQIVGRYETDKAFPKVDYLQKVAKCCNCYFILDKNGLK